MTVHDVVQRSPEWHALRLGRLCGSRAADMLAVGAKGQPLASRANLRVQLVLERITGRTQEATFVTDAMQDGIDREEVARSVYEVLSGNATRLVGFVSHDELRAGCSPDAMVSDDGILEIKCPIQATHWEYMKSGLVPDKYVKQCVHNMWITGAQWCDYVSFNPDFPDPLHARIVRVNRDARVMANYEAQVRKFLAEVDLEVQAVETMVNSAEQWAKAVTA
jgi:putative phage-type endonuclease